MKRDKSEQKDTKFFLDERLMALLTDLDISEDDKEYYMRISILSNSLKILGYDMMKDKELWMKKLSEDDLFKEDLLEIINNLTEIQEQNFKNKIKHMSKELYGDITFSLIGLILFLSLSISNIWKIVSLIIYLIVLFKSVKKIVSYYMSNKNIFIK